MPTPGPLLSAVYNNTYFPVQTNGETVITVTGYAGTSTNVAQQCLTPKHHTITILRVLTDFNRNNETELSDYRHCLGEPDRLEAFSTTNSSATVTYTWNYGDATSGYINPSGHIYQTAGTYSIELFAMETSNNCKASITKTIEILPLPTASLILDNSSCPQVPFHIAGTGTPGISGPITGTVVSILSSIPQQFDSLNTFSDTLRAQESTTYSLIVTDNNGCKSTAATASIYIQPPIKHIEWDTTVVIGQPIPLNAFMGEGFTYTWSPVVTWLDCDTCLFYNPVSSSTVDITYTVMVEDSMQCAVEKNFYKIKINPVISLDVPTAFTPNGDGINDIIFPNGWGLRKLNYFRVFNRWGQLIFESNDFKTGWNGMYQGVPQNMETYVYQV